MDIIKARKRTKNTIKNRLVTLLIKTLYQVRKGINSATYTCANFFIDREVTQRKFAALMKVRSDRSEYNNAIPVSKGLIAVSGFMTHSGVQVGSFLHKHKRAVVTGFSVACCAVIISTVVVDNMTVYEYSYKGQLLGVVKNETELKKAIESLEGMQTEEDGPKIVIDEEKDIVVVKKTRSFGEEPIKVDSEKEVINNITKLEDVQVQAFELTINGTAYGELATKEEAEGLLDDIKTYMTGETDFEKYKEAEFVENVGIKEVTTAKINIDNVEVVYGTILGGTLNIETYVVKKGDTLYDIARNNGVTQDDLEAWNPGIHSTVIHAGDEIKLQDQSSMLNVRTLETSTYEVEIPFETDYEYDDSMFEEHEETLVVGVVGKRTVEGDIVRLNGVETERIELSSTTTVEPSRQLVKKGTLKEPPKVATGTFITPINGIITSNFGYRWGSLHDALDYGASVGTDVLASDGGEVTYAGWNGGGYGYLVRIDHGNGMSTAYAHNSQVIVSVGERVYQGQHIAESGNTGYSTGPHLHFSIFKNGVAQDPLGYL